MMWLMKSMMLLAMFALVVAAGLGAANHGLKSEYPATLDATQGQLPNFTTPKPTEERLLLQFSKSCARFLQQAARTVMHGVTVLLD